MTTPTRTPPGGTTPHLRVLDTAVEGHASALVLGGVRIALGVLWLTNVGWKIPPDFGQERGRGLFAFVNDAVTHPVFPPWSWVVREVILPNFRLFGWAVLIVEACLGAFLLFGLGTRFWALVGVAQSTAIGLSVLRTPNEWPWSYYLMVLAHLAIFAAAAGRTIGLDGVLRPTWAARSSRWSRLLLRAS
ncbi:MAG: TQO small subunit DoxD [Acidimicrobiales bacterium]